MPEMTEIVCRYCGVRLYWDASESDPPAKVVCWDCSEDEACARWEDLGKARREDAVIERGIRQWEEAAAEIRAMIHDDERRS